MLRHGVAIQYTHRTYYSQNAQTPQWGHLLNHTVCRIKVLLGWWWRALLVLGGGSTAAVREAKTQWGRFFPGGLSSIQHQTLYKDGEEKWDGSADSSLAQLSLPLQSFLMVVRVTVQPGSQAYEVMLIFFSVTYSNVLIDCLLTPLPPQAMIAQSYLSNCN